MLSSAEGVMKAIKLFAVFRIFDHIRQGLLLSAVKTSAIFKLFCRMNSLLLRVRADVVVLALTDCCDRHKMVFILCNINICRYFVIVDLFRLLPVSLFYIWRFDQSPGLTKVINNIIKTQQQVRSTKPIFNVCEAN